MTALEMIRQAMLETGIIAQNESIAATDANDALKILKGMLAQWELEGIAIGQADLELTTVLPWPENHDRPVMTNFAVRLCPSYGAEPSGITLQDAADGYRVLQGAYGEPHDMDVDPYLWRRRFPSGRWIA